MDTFSDDPSFIPLPESQCELQLMIGQTAAVGGNQLAVAGLSNFRVPQSIQDRISKTPDHQTLAPERLTRVYLFYRLRAAEGLDAK